MAEGELRQIQAKSVNEAHFRALVELAPTGIFIQTRHRFAFLNQAACEVFGASKPEDLLGKPVIECFQPEVREQVTARIRNLNEHMSPVVDNAEEAVLRLDGQRRIAQVSAIPFLFEGENGALVFVKDITEARQASHQLAEETERLAVTLRSIGDGVITTDTQGRVTNLNTIAEDLTGWRLDEARGQPLSKVFVIVNELTRQPCEDPVGKVLKTRSVVELANHTCLISRNGREYVIADSGAPILDNTGTILGVVLVFRDMTEKQKLSDSLQRAQKLESIGALAGGIAHDFNNLLTGIFGNLCMAKQSLKAGDTKETMVLLEHCLGIFERAKNLTQQLLVFSKGGEPVRKVQEIGTLVQKSAQFALSGSNVSAKFDIAHNLWYCNCDQHQIGQVVDNLVINARQSMPDGGIVEVCAKNRVLDPGPKGPASRRGKFIEIQVRDHGVGISRELLSRIFDPFFSTRKTGHGLGLATVFSILQKHDGWIDVESDVGKGSVFHVFLPADATTLEAASGQENPDRRLRILVLDDEMHILMFLERMLDFLGYDTVTATSGKEAVELFRQAEESGQPIFAGILDLTIPGGMGGAAAAQEILRFRPDAILVASSGYSDDPIVANPDQYGFQSSLVKPYLMEELETLLLTLVAHH